MAKKNKVKLLDAIEELGQLPDETEIQRLIKYYPTYEWEHRQQLLTGYFKSVTLEELVKAKIKAKGLRWPLPSPQSKGGHTRWVKDKVKRTIVRILFLRYCLDEGYTKNKANQKLLKPYGSRRTTEDSGQSNIRKMTHSKVLDNKPNKAQKA